MRDKNRIRPICAHLASIWEKYPDMRLGQLLLNVARDPAIYYLEDEELIKMLEEFYNYEGE